MSSSSNRVSLLARSSSSGIMVSISGQLFIASFMMVLAERAGEREREREREREGGREGEGERGREGEREAERCEE